MRYSELASDDRVFILWVAFFCGIIVGCTVIITIEGSKDILTEPAFRDAPVEIQKETIIKEIYMQNITRYVHEYKEVVNFYPRNYRECRRRAYEELITGQSMLPLTDVKPDGSMSVWVEPVSFAELDLGDVIVYRKGNGTVFHAITYINKDYARTAGYNNYREDEENVYPNQIIARYCVK